MRYAVAPGVGYARDGEVVVAARWDTGERVVLGGPAASIWELAVAGASGDAVVQAHRAQFDDPDGVLEAQVQGALAELVALGLLVAEADGRLA